MRIGSGVAPRAAKPSTTAESLVRQGAGEGHPLEMMRPTAEPETDKRCMGGSNRQRPASGLSFLLPNLP